MHRVLQHNANHEIEHFLKKMQEYSNDELNNFINKGHIDPKIEVEFLQCYGEVYTPSYVYAWNTSPLHENTILLNFIQDHTKQHIYGNNELKNFLKENNAIDKR